MTQKSIKKEARQPNAHGKQNAKKREAKIRYIPPFGATDPEQNYQNGDPTIGRQGSIPSAAVFENPQREIISVISHSRLVPSDADLEQLAKAIRSQRLNYVEDQGSPNNIIVTLSPPLGAYTRGLVLRVRMRHTNTDAVRINAGPGNAPVRKMNGADVGPGELSVGGVVTMVYDGAVFQLSNFMAGGGATEIINVKIPYTVDSSLQPNTIIADFLPALTQNEMVAGMMIAVKIANTNTGPTQMLINGMPGITLRANGSSGTPVGMTLQGDINRDDVVLFFYDGQYLWFAPNPEISDFVTYDVGDGGQFTDLESALDEIRRKTVGANGYVDFVLRRGTYGPIKFSHPSADRMRISGTLNTGNPGGPSIDWTQLARSGTSSAQLNNDYGFNLSLLQQRYGTVIRPSSTHADANPWTIASGIEQAGPGMIVFRDLLILGTRRLTTQANWWQTGITARGTNIWAQNVAVAGCNTGSYTGGQAWFDDCTFVGMVNHGMWNDGGNMRAFSSVVTGTGTGRPSTYPGYGVVSRGGLMYGVWMRSVSNELYGFYGAGAFELWGATALNNGQWDAYAFNGGNIGFISGSHPGEQATFSRVSPPLNTVGNVGAIVTHSVAGSFPPWGAAI